MASKKWKPGALSFFKSRVKDVPEAQPSGRSVSADYKVKVMQRNQAAYASAFSGDPAHIRYPSDTESKEASEKKGYLHSRSDSAGALPSGGQTGDLLFLEIRCKQLKDERDTFEQMFVAEQQKNRRMVRRFSTQELEGVQLDEMAQDAAVQRLELQLHTFSQRCDSLTAVVRERDKELKRLNGQVLELEGSTTVSEQLVALHVRKVNHLRDELAKSEADNLRMQQHLEERSIELATVSQTVERLEELIARSKADYEDQIMHLKEELAKAEFDCFDLHRSLEDKTAEARKLTELVNFLENQVSKAQQKMINIQGEIMHLKTDLARSEGTWVESFCQLEQVHAKRISEWNNERTGLLEQVRQLQWQAQEEEELYEGFADVDDVFEFRPRGVGKSKLNRSFSLDSRKDTAFLYSPQISPARFPSPQRSSARYISPQRSPPRFASQQLSPVRTQGLIQALLDIGEASLDTVDEEELASWKSKLAEVERREYAATEELMQKAKELSELESTVAQLKTELKEEKERAKEEAEDLAQEMAELRYQLMEMLDQERELRARTEQASVHRVEELEAQLKRSRQETVAALARRRESEARVEKASAEVLSLQHLLKEQMNTVNQLRNDNEEWFRLNEEETVQAVGPYRTAWSPHVAQLPMLSIRQLDDESEEGEDDVATTPTVSAGVQLFEEWVKSGCGTRLWEPVRGDHDMTQNDAETQGAPVISRCHLSEIESQETPVPGPHRLVIRKSSVSKVEDGKEGNLASELGPGGPDCLDEAKDYKEVSGLEDCKSEAVETELSILQAAEPEVCGGSTSADVGSRCTAEGLPDGDLAVGKALTSEASPPATSGADGPVDVDDSPDAGFEHEEPSELEATDLSRVVPASEHLEETAELAKSVLDGDSGDATQMETMEEGALVQAGQSMPAIGVGTTRTGTNELQPVLQCVSDDKDTQVEGVRISMEDVEPSASGEQRTAPKTEVQASSQDVEVRETGEAHISAANTGNEGLADRNGSSGILEGDEKAFEGQPLGLCSDGSPGTLQAGETGQVELVVDTALSHAPEVVDEYITATVTQGNGDVGVAQVSEVTAEVLASAE